MDRVKGECSTYSGYDAVGKVLAAAGMEPRPNEPLAAYASRIADKPEHEQVKED